jgi:hypothetical protein
MCNKRQGRDTSGEMLSEPVLARCEQRDGTAAGFSQELVHRRLPRDREADERRIERKTDERSDGETEPLIVDFHRDDRDAMGIAVHQVSEVVFGHGADPMRRVECP